MHFLTTGLPAGRQFLPQVSAVRPERPLALIAESILIPACCKTCRLLAQDMHLHPSKQTCRLWERARSAGSKTTKGKSNTFPTPERGEVLGTSPFFDRYTVVFSLVSSLLPDWTGRQNRPIVFSTPHPAAAVVHRQTPPGIPGIPAPGSYHPRPCPGLLRPHLRSPLRRFQCQDRTIRSPRLSHFPFPLPFPFGPFALP